MIIQDSLFAMSDPNVYPTHVLSWGLGADSTAILLRWLSEPASRDFPLEALLVITAHTGDEYPSTLRDTEEVVLPALRTYGVRLVQPESGARALYLEAVSVCFNPKQGLLAAGRLIDAVRAAGLTEVLQLFEARVAATEHGLYEVRRVAQARGGRTPMIARCVKQLGRGEPTTLSGTLLEQPGETITGSDGITRVVRVRRGTQLPWVEHFYVVAPSAAVQDKARPGFEAMFNSVAHPDLTLI